MSKKMLFPILLLFTFIIAIILTGCQPIDSIVPPDMATSFTSYQFEASKNDALSSDIIGNIDLSKYTISLTVPSGTDVTSLVATFALAEDANAKIGTTPQDSGVQQMILPNQLFIR